MYQVYPKPLSISILILHIKKKTDCSEVIQPWVPRWEVAEAGSEDKQASLLSLALRDEMLLMVLTLHQGDVDISPTLLPRHKFARRGFSCA